MVFPYCRCPTVIYVASYKLVNDRCCPEQRIFCGKDDLFPVLTHVLTGLRLLLSYKTVPLAHA